MNIIKKRKNSEIEYEISNDALKEKHTKISEILDKNGESKKKINSEKSSVLAELNNLQKKDNMQIYEKGVNDMIKRDLEINSNHIKKSEFKKENNKCNIY